MGFLRNYAHNRYDVYLFLLIVSTMFGIYGGALTAPRLMTIILLPSLLGKLTRTTMNYITPIVVFFAFWFAYMVLSLLWTPDRGRGVEELLYYIVHMVYFVEIIVFGIYAKNPIKTVAFSWLFAFLCTSVIAGWEITTDHHLSVAHQGEDRTFRHGGSDVFYQRYASVTFYNYNNYVVYICYALPFFYFLLSSVKEFSHKFISTMAVVAALILSIVIILYNASRGGIITYVGLLILYGLFFSRSRKSGRYAFVFFVVLLVAIAISRPELFDTILYRLESRSMFDGSGRMGIWKTAFDAFGKTIGLGAGLGGVSDAMEGAGSTVITIPHNMFVELLLEHGIFVFLFVIAFLIRLFFKGCRSDKLYKQTIIMAFISFVSTFIISSGYLLHPQTWAYFASLFIFAYLAPQKNSYVQN